jgi:predicted phage-related endonuclease
MSNDRADFEPEVRNSAWWSGDSRLVANGKGNEAVMYKLGLMEREDLSEVEAVQMGHVMQPVIGRLASERLKLNLRDADYAMTHASEPWLRSHFDFIDESGTHLVEAKNYGAHQRSKFDDGIIPAPDYAQLLHECAVHGVRQATLAVLFGGQTFETFTFQFSHSQVDEFIKEMAQYWAAVATRTPLAPETVEQARIIFKSESDGAVTANAQIEKIANALKHIKANIKAYEEEEKKYSAALMSFMGEKNQLVTIDGTVLATWKAPKPSKRFDAKLFQSSMPDLYEKFMVEQSSSRRFLLK